MECICSHCEPHVPETHSPLNPWPAESSWFQQKVAHVCRSQVAHDKAQEAAFTTVQGPQHSFKENTVTTKLTYNGYHPPSLHLPPPPSPPPKKIRFVNYMDASAVTYPSLNIFSCRTRSLKVDHGPNRTGI